MMTVKGMMFAAILGMGLMAATPSADAALKAGVQAKKNNGGKKKQAKKNNGGKK